MTTEYVGYWAENKQEFPFPEPAKSVFPGLNRFIERLNFVENNIADVCDYMGWSTCRLCSIDNGSQEYVLSTATGTIRWPQGYVHYLKEHNIHPPNSFYDLINRVYSEYTKCDYDRSGRKRNKNDWSNARNRKYGNLNKLF